LIIYALAKKKILLATFFKTVRYLSVWVEMRKLNNI